MDGENISTSLYQSFLTVSLYHGGAFTGLLKVIFMFVVPALLIGAIPVEIVNNVSILNVFGITLLSFVWLILAIKFFYFSLKKYESNNFFGFGN